MNILAVDFGTSSVKMGIYKDDLSEVKTVKVKYDYDVMGLFAQIDPEIVYNAFVEGCHQLEDLIKTVDILAFDVFSPCLIAMDKDGNALYPAIIHVDRRSYAQSRFALKQLPKEKFLEINGNLPFAGGISLTSMLWIKQEQPDVYKKTAVLGHLNTYLHKKFVGKFYIDPSNASFTGLYETMTGKGWSKEMTDALGIDRALLPEIVPSLSIAGKLCAEAARQTGLPEGLPVLMGANDSSSAAYGAGAVENGDIMNLSGSSEIVTVTTTNPVPHPKYYLRTSVEEGKWLYLAITVGGFAFEWFRKQFCRVRFLPHLAGDRHSLVKKKGGFSGLTMDTTREDMLRALLVGTYDPVLEALSIIGKTTKLNPGIYWSGGMVSDEYQQFKGKVFDGFHFIPRADCSSLGMVKASVVTMNGGK